MISQKKSFFASSILGLPSLVGVYDFSAGSGSTSSSFSVSTTPGNFLIAHLVATSSAGEMAINGGQGWTEKSGSTQSSKMYTRISAGPQTITYSKGQFSSVAIRVYEIKAASIVYLGAPSSVTSANITALGDDWPKPGLNFVISHNLTTADSYSVTNPPGTPYSQQGGGAIGGIAYVSYVAKMEAGVSPNVPLTWSGSSAFRAIQMRVSR